MLRPKKKRDSGQHWPNQNECYFVLQFSIIRFFIAGEAPKTDDPQVAAPQKRMDLGQRWPNQNECYFVLQFSIIRFFIAGEEPTERKRRRQAPLPNGYIYVRTALQKYPGMAVFAAEMKHLSITTRAEAIAESSYCATHLMFSLVILAGREGVARRLRRQGLAEVHHQVPSSHD
jgi:hypothetical protein